MVCSSPSLAPSVKTRTGCPSSLHGTVRGAPDVRRSSKISKASRICGAMVTSFKCSTDHLRTSAKASLPALPITWASANCTRPKTLRRSLDPMRPSWTKLSTVWLILDTLPSLFLIRTPSERTSEPRAVHLHSKRRARRRERGHLVPGIIEPQPAH